MIKARTWWWWCRASWPRMSVDILGTNCDQFLSMVQCCFTSTETVRLIRRGNPGWPPRLSHTQLLNSKRLGPLTWLFWAHSTANQNRRCKFKYTDLSASQVDYVRSPFFLTYFLECLSFMLFLSPSSNPSICKALNPVVKTSLGACMK